MLNAPTPACDLEGTSDDSWDSESQLGSNVSVPAMIPHVPVSVSRPRSSLCDVTGNRDGQRIAALAFNVGV